MKFRVIILQVLLVVVVSDDSSDSIWPKGHLLPLGSHRPPETVEERSEFPSPQEFWENYVNISKPVVFRGGALQSEAMKLWTEEYFREKYGDLEVRLEGKKEKQSNIPIGAKGIGRDTFENFINHFHESNAYVVSELPTPMWDDVTVIPPLTCGTFADRLVEVDLWMSGGGTSSILHKDAFNAVNCLLNGTKEWKLIEYKHQDKIYKVWEPDREIGGFSALNVEAVDLIKYPRVKDVPWAFTTIHAGDCLFLPKSMWHQVKSYGTHNVAVALLFSRFDNVSDIEFTGCDKPLTHEPLSKFELDWQYPGRGEMTMGNPDLYYIKDMLRQSILEDKDQMLRVENIAEWFNKAYDEKDYDWAKKRAEKSLAIIESFNNGPFYLKDIENCNKSCLRAISLSIEPTIPENTEDFEYNYINPDDLQNLILKLTEKHNQLEKSAFVRQYQKVVHGTEKFALKMFTSLSGGENDKTVLTLEEVIEHLEEALQPYRDLQSDQPEPPDNIDMFQSPYEERDSGTEPVEDYEPLLKDEL